MSLDLLAACAGRWHGVNTLHDPHTGGPVDTPGTATVTPLHGGRFVRLDYTWSYDGRPQEGSLLIGHQRKADVATAHWIDTWHMGEQVLARAGRVDGGGVVVVLGAYAAPEGPDWGWRIEIAPESGRALRLTMHNIPPEGDEEVAVEAAYTPAP